MSSSAGKSDSAALAMRATIGVPMMSAPDNICRVLLDPPAAGPWKKHAIAPRFQDAYEAVARDLDGDGDVDVAATSWRTPGRVAWFENHGDPRGRWTMHVLKTDWRSANQIIIADLNGDGRPDIAAIAEHGSYELRWWRNK